MGTWRPRSATSCICEARLSASAGQLGSESPRRLYHLVPSAEVRRSGDQMVAPNGARAVRSRMTRAKNERIPITATGLAALGAEVAALVERRPSMVARVASARSDGDLKENFAYHDARRDLGMADGRVQTIEAILQNAVVIEATAANGSIGIGSKVVVTDEFGESSYEVVGPAEGAIARGLISLASPMGAALMGRSVGDTISFTTPGGERSARVVQVDYATPRRL